MRCMSSVVIVDDDSSNDDVIHVFSSLKADLLNEDRETSQSKHLSDHLFLNLSHMRFLFQLNVDLYVQNTYDD